MAKSPYFSGFGGLALMMGASLALSLTAAGCGGSGKPAVSSSEASAQAQSSASEPDLVAVIVGTEGRDHLLKDGYPLTKIADIIEVLKPDMILIQIRADAYK